MIALSPRSPEVDFTRVASHWCQKYMTSIQDGCCAIKANGLNTNSISMLQEGDVCNVVVPFDVEDRAELSLVALLKPHSHRADWK